MQKELFYQYESKLHAEILKLCHKLEVPLHLNHFGSKKFTEYQRISLIVLFMRSRKALRDFVAELYESRWPMLLGLRDIPSKSTVHNWMKRLDMKTIRHLLSASVTQPTTAAVDATGIDSWQRTRHYDRRIGSPYMPFAKLDVFVDVDSQRVLDHVLRIKPRHDVHGAETMFKRTPWKDVFILADKGYDAEPLHGLVRERGNRLFAPVRTSSRSTPKGFYRKQCLDEPENKGRRSIVESVIRRLKTRIRCLRSRLHYMKKREMAWHILAYNLELFAQLLKQLRWLTAS